MKRRERGQLIRRGPETWLLRAYVGRVADRRVYRSRTLKGTRRNAQKALTEWVRQSDNGELQYDNRITLKEYLERWLHKKLTISERSKHDYRTRLEADVIPALGQLRLIQVTTDKIEELYAELSKRLAPSTLRYTHAVPEVCAPGRSGTRPAPEEPCRCADRAAERQTATYQCSDA